MTAFDRTPIRARRARLPRSMQRDAAAAVAARARRLDALTAARRVGAYVPVRGELDPWPLIVAARRRGARVYLPVADPSRPDRGLDFAAYDEGEPLEPAAFGIPAPPASAPRIDPRDLEVVLVPVVAFDPEGTRAGSGAGFYDRTFAFRLVDHHVRRPLLVGLAHRWQEVGALDPAPWDVPLDAVLTDAALRWFPRGTPRAGR